MGVSLVDVIHANFISKVFPRNRHDRSTRQILLNNPTQFRLFGREICIRHSNLSLRSRCIQIAPRSDQKQQACGLFCRMFGNPKSAVMPRVTKGVGTWLRIHSPVSKDKKQSPTEVETPRPRALDGGSREWYFPSQQQSHSYRFQLWTLPSSVAQFVDVPYQALNAVSKPADLRDRVSHLFWGQRRRWQRWTVFVAW